MKPPAESLERREFIKVAGFEGVTRRLLHY
jgi:hypothetical protein